MFCLKCHKEIPEESKFCLYCGAKQTKEKISHRRLNGEGSVFKTKSGHYRLQYTYFKAGKRYVKTKSGFRTKADALAYLPKLKEEKTGRSVLFKEAYEATIKAKKTISKSTIGCYRSAFAFFSPLHNVEIDDIEVDDLQECIDDCPKGKRTKQNMKALISIMWTYEIPRCKNLRNINLGQYLAVNDNSSPASRESFTAEQLEMIRSLIGSVDYADYVYCQCYLGMRPTELLELQPSDYHADYQYFVGGIKTEAGKDRIVTISPRILPLIDDLLSKGRNYVFYNKSTDEKLRIEAYRDAFYNVLEKAGIDNPVDENGLHKFTPHSCRHTFATMLKNAPGADKDKLEIIGHTSTAMLMYYQGTNFEDLKRITDSL